MSAELLRVKDLSTWLTISERSVRELCRESVRARQKHPLPMLKINRAVRFLRSDVEQWLEQLKEMVIDSDHLQRRVAAHILLDSGHSFEFVAEKVSVDLLELLAWHRRGRPLMHSFRSEINPEEIPREG